MGDLVVFFSASGGTVGLGVDAHDLRSAVGEGLKGGDGEVGGAHEDAAEILKVWRRVDVAPPRAGIWWHYRGRSRARAKGGWVG